MTTNDNDELKALIGTILRIDIEGHSVPLYGRLISVNRYWITIERKNGDHRIVSLGRIQGIEPVGRS